MKITAFAAMILLLSFVGCMHVQNASIQYPVYQYDAPADFIYLKVLDVLNDEEDWVLHLTDKSNGTIEIKNISQLTAQESDIQHAKFIVKRIDREHTSVEIDADASLCRGDACLKILERVNNRIKQVPARIKDESPQTT